LALKLLIFFISEIVLSRAGKRNMISTEYFITT